jgi:glycine/D-amino acid oxidase-like deaminating enzyme
MHSADVIVVGGGMFGAAIAHGLARRKIDTVMLDGADDALRAARGNFGLIWVQSKGLGLQRYTEWSRESAKLWTGFAADLRDSAGIDVSHRNQGGLQLLLGDEEVEARRDFIERMRQQAGPDGFDCEIIGRQAVQDMLPDIRIGDAVSAASFSPDDGDVNPLRLLRAMHRGFTRLGGRYRSGCEVTDIGHRGGVFVARTAGGHFTAPKIVLAAGHGISRLAPMVGLKAPIRPQRGQILITERVRSHLDMPVGSIRQTDEGGFQFGVSEEDVGFDDGTTLAVTGDIARRAIASFPGLASLALLRSWGCVRVLTPDKCAVYDESQSHPGAFVATSHSGVTLAAINAHHVSRWIADGATPPGFAQFSAERFDVPATA